MIHVFNIKKGRDYFENYKDVENYYCNMCKSMPEQLKQDTFLCIRNKKILILWRNRPSTNIVKPTQVGPNRQDIFKN